jgi:4-hydroxy-tetrahydrodipicolinate synthase
MTSSSVPLTGSIVALVTPMHEDGSVDYPALRKLIDWHIAEGTDCIGVVGTTGESPTVNVEEHCEIIRVAVEQAAKRVPIMAGCGANSTAEAIELAKFAKKVGADTPAAGGALLQQAHARRPIPALQGHCRGRG